MLSQLPHDVATSTHLVKCISLLGLGGGAMRALGESSKPSVKAFIKHLLFAT